MSARCSRMGETWVDAIVGVMDVIIAVMLLVIVGTPANDRAGGMAPSPAEEGVVSCRIMLRKW